MTKVSRIFPIPETISCRVCGGTQAGQEQEAFGRVCNVCWRKFKYHLRKAPVTQLAFDKWLGRELFLAVNRLSRNGILGRCEAVTARAIGQPYREGYQCARPATARVNGRGLCGSHAISANLVLIGELVRSPYDTMADLMGDVAKRDDKFRQCLEKALALSATDQSSPLPSKLPSNHSGGK